MLCVGTIQFQKRKRCSRKTPGEFCLSKARPSVQHQELAAVQGVVRKLRKELLVDFLEPQPRSLAVCQTDAHSQRTLRHVLLPAERSDILDILDVSARITTHMQIFLDRSGVGHFLLAPIRRHPLGLESNCAVNAMATRSPDSGKFRGLAIIMTSSHCCFVTTTSSSLPSIPVLAEVRPRLEEEQFSCRAVERERLRSF